jgi:hypothetical protein
MAINLIRNTRVFFTSNVDTNTGIVSSTGFSTSNTQEIQVLDGFSFSQNTNQETVTVSEAGTTPVRGQQSFNTSLAPVDFSFSTYLRPYNNSSKITAEESCLWNAMFGDKALDTTVTIGSITGSSYSTSTGQITITGTSLTNTSSISNGDVVIVTGMTSATSSELTFLNSAAVVTGTPGTGSVVLALVNPSLTALTPTNTTGSITLYKSAWAPTATSGTLQSIATTAASNLNQLQKFGLIFLVDNATYVVDNCALAQATIDFGLDAIAMVQWTGQATALRQVTNLSLTGSGITITGTSVTGISSTENIFPGNTVVISGSTSGTTPAVITSGNTISSIASATSLTLTSSATTSGSATNVKVYNINSTGSLSGTALTVTSTKGVSVGDVITATGTARTITAASPVVGTVTGTGPWTATITGVTATGTIAAGDIVTATSGTGNLGTGTATVSSIVANTSITVTFTGGTAPVQGNISSLSVAPLWTTGTSTVKSVTSDTVMNVTFGGTAPADGTYNNITVLVANLSAAVNQVVAASKNLSAPFITNKLSTVEFTTLNKLGSIDTKTYTIALTGGSITINNNISYITPANLAVVNVPAVYYTGTRAITGTMNAYLRTGTNETGTGQLLADTLSAASSTVSPMASLSIAIGGKTNSNRVVLDMPAVTFTIPTVDAQQVVSTSINFTAQGYVASSTANANTFDLTKNNDLVIRYFAAAAA